MELTAAKRVKPFAQVDSFNPQNIENYNSSNCFSCFIFHPRLRQASFSWFTFTAAFIKIRCFIHPRRCINSLSYLPACALLLWLARANRYVKMISSFLLLKENKKSSADPAAREKIIKESLKIDKETWYPQVMWELLGSRGNLNLELSLVCHNFTAGCRILWKTLFLWRTNIIHYLRITIFIDLSTRLQTRFNKQSIRKIFQLFFHRRRIVKHKNFTLH